MKLSANMFKKEDFDSGLPKVDGSSIRGFTEIQESDLIIRPDPSTFATVPWIPEYPTARLICDILSGGSNRDQFSRDPRGIAKKAEEYMKANGYELSYWGTRSRVFCI
ncbi:MAG: glutamine synthetase beta-grasp domain-containing protein [Nitrososphaeraceae archaeon]|nr:glutamine synthetase beta-grasp domain-containing protein [Nitrososphaeraceae archaeon]